MSHVNSFVVVFTLLVAIFAPYSLALLFTASRGAESESHEFDYR